MVTYRKETRMLPKLIWGALAVLIILCYLMPNVASTSYYSLPMQSETTVKTPPVVLQSGTAGNSTIYANSTSAKVRMETGWLSGWDKRVKITIDNNEIDSALSNFPVLIYLSNSSGRNNEDISFVFDELQSDANRGKIAATTSDGITQVNVEIERWNTTREQAWLWVNVPSISSVVDTYLYLYYDMNQPDNTGYVGDIGSDAAKNVWDSSFKGVWHLGETTGGSGSIKDSTSNNNHGTTYGTPTLGATGQIDNAINFDGVDDYISIPNSGSLQFTSSLTIEAWIRLDSFGAGSDVDAILRKGEANPNDYQIAIHDQRLELMIEENDDAGLHSSASLSATTWYYTIGTWNGSTRKVYLNGSENGSGSKIGSIIPDTRAIYIGGRSGTDLSDGIIDEVRASNTARSAAWIKASYESGRDDLLDFWSEERNIQDYVDNNTSDVDASADKGTHSNFTTQKYTDSIYDTLTEANTGQSTTLTNLPSATTGTWTNPANAFADGTNFASITSATPSATQAYSSYGFNLPSDATVTSVRVRYDAWSIGTSGLTSSKNPTTNTGGTYPWTNPSYGYTSNNQYATAVATIPTWRATGAMNHGTTSAITVALPAGMSANDIVILVASTIAGGSITITADGSVTPWTPISGSPIDVTGGEKLYVWWGRYSSGSTGVTITPGGDHIVGRCVAYYNCYAGGSPIDVAATGTETTSDTSFSFATGLTTTYNNEMTITVCSTGNDPAFDSTAQFSSWSGANLGTKTERMDNDVNEGGGGGFGLMEASLVANGAVGTVGATLAAASPKSYITFALRSTVPNNTFDQIYGTFGITGTGTITKVEIGYEAYSSVAQELDLYTSSNGGSTWNAIHTTANLGTSDPNAYTYIDVTSDTTWTWTLLNDANFKYKVVTRWLSGTPTWYVDALVARITYTGINDEQIRVDVSWDGGASWSSKQTTGLNGTETTYWYNVTLATSWTPSAVNQIQTRVDAYTVGDTGEVRLDWIPVEVKYTPANYELDLEVQWTNCNYTQTNEYLCINVGTVNTEDILVQVWSGGNWNTVFSDLTASQWNNVSVSSYLVSSTFTIRFKGGTEVGDTTQDSWNIDAAFLHVSSQAEDFNYVLRMTEKEGSNWKLRLSAYDQSSVSRLKNCSIYIYDGSNSTQIIILNGAYNQQTGPWYDLTASDTEYIWMHIETSSSGTSYVYAYLEILVPNTTTYARYIITFEIT